MLLGTVVAATGITKTFGKGGVTALGSATVRPGASPTERSEATCRF